MSTLLISSISDIGVPWRVNSKEKDSKQNFVNNINIQADYFPIHFCFPCFFFLVKRLAFITRNFVSCFQSLLTKIEENFCS